MHDCPECGGACDCDGEDHHQPAPDDCQHECQEFEETDDDDPEDDDFGDGL